MPARVLLYVTRTFPSPPGSGTHSTATKGPKEERETEIGIRRMFITLSSTTLEMGEPENVLSRYFICCSSHFPESCPAESVKMKRAIPFYQSQQ
ncbi:hypothetical protein BSKO_01212 [Bryopsis sp. KO-2023]|nr:hypothetical protein BSKO_01212 [Bryopsis sp. KO-2023]